MRRPPFLCASLAALILGACSLTQSLDDLKQNAGKDGGAGSSATGGTGGADAQAKLCEKGVDCTGCADCTTFCQCGAPAVQVDNCIANCVSTGDAGGTGGSAGAAGAGGAAGGTDAGNVQCDNLVCDPTSSPCCVTSTSASCDAQCSGTTVYCDGPEDCSADEQCCATLIDGNYDALKCDPDCTGANKSVVCGSSGSCPGSLQCQQSSVLPSYTICK